MTVNIHVAQNTDVREWNELNSQSPHGTLFHEWDWLKIVEKHTHSTLFPILGEKNGVPVGIFPLFLQRKGPLKMVFSPPPRVALFYLGPVFSGIDTLKQETWETIYTGFQASVDDFIKNELNADYVSISLPPALNDPRPFYWSEYSVSLRYDYVIDLSGGTENLFQKIDKKRRQDINRTKKRGITVEIGQKPEYEKVLDLLDLRYRQQNKLLTETRGYLDDIFDRYRDNITVFVAKHEGDIITGLIDLHYKDRIYSWIGNIKPIVPISPSPMDLINWEAVSYGSTHGFKYYVLLSAAGNQRLHAYSASKFDPEILIRYHAKKSSFTAGILERGYTGFLKPIMGRINGIRGGGTEFE